MYLFHISKEFICTGKPGEAVERVRLSAEAPVHISPNTFMYGNILSRKIIVIFIIGIIHPESSVFQTECDFRPVGASGDCPGSGMAVQGECLGQGHMGDKGAGKGIIFPAAFPQLKSPLKERGIRQRLGTVQQPGQIQVIVEQDLFHLTGVSLNHIFFVDSSAFFS